MKSGRFLVLAGILAIAVTYIAYGKRYQLAAKVWHWKHGYSITMGDYEVPVPEHWLIADQGSVAFTLLNTAPIIPRDAKFHTAPVITVFPFQNGVVGTEGLEF